MSSSLPKAQPQETEIPEPQRPAMQTNLPGTRDPREQRLYEIRRQGEQALKTARPGPAPASTPAQASADNGYYGKPLLKPPQWTAEVPIYFFVGGMAGAASVIAAVGQFSSADRRLIRHARWLAAIGGLISPALLIADLGMPSRFLHMLRVFKIQSPMSVGSWTLVAFSNSAVAAAMLGELRKRRPPLAVRILRDSAQAASALTGLILSTYTGVLVGATAIPAWNEHVASLPIHFAASGMGAAASVLELTGNDCEQIHRIAMGAAALETAMGASIEIGKKPATRSLHSGVSGWTMRSAGLLSGPVPLVLRLLSLGRTANKKNLRRSAVVCALLGSLLTRFAWLQAGKSSAADNSVPLSLNKPGKRS
jgi:formate-dependent nitrite reductase membrane component NrfD